MEQYGQNWLKIVCKSRYLGFFPAKYKEMFEYFRIHKVYRIRCSWDYSGIF